MPLPTDSERFKRHWAAGGGPRGTKPIKPMLKGEWKPSMPVHWLEETRFLRYKYYLVRFLMIFQFLAGIAYLQFRARETIGIFERSRRPHFLTYQIFFFVLEVISVFSVTFRFFEAWRVCRRNCIDFKYIPNHLIHPIPFNSPRNAVTKEHSNYPSIGVFIPCYNEDVDLVLETLLGAVHIDYPKQLLTIYLCDDGKDVRKRALVSQLRKRYKNIHYVIRPDHTHAKAGNLNYSLERTTTDIVITLDADFVARPNIAQRLLPYFYVWNSDIEKYEFNETLAVVQTPQHFRNLSPYDSDPLDQRSTFFFELVLPGKDWFNASTMIGTNNMLSRVALKEAGYYPYHSITEDTAMSLRFHQLGYRTYFVNESLATGLATTSLWSNLGQRARWLKGDWQILFSMKGPLTAKGLSLLQRLLYVHMTYARLISVVHFMYDVGAVLLLVFGISPLDAPDPKKFIIFVSIFLMAGIVVRVVLTAGGHGLDKSESGAMAFEPIFRYITVKGLFTALVKGQDLKFKVTDKSQAVKNGNKKEAQDEEEEEAEQFQHDPRMTVLGRPSPETPAQGLVGSTPENVKHPEPIDNHVVPISGQDDSSSTSESEDEDGRGFKRRKRVRSAEEVQEHRRNIFKNLKRIWFNIVMAILLIFAITYGFINPPTDTQTVVVEVDGVLGTFAYQNILPLAMALGFAMVNLLPHLLAIYLCFIPYVSGWDMADLVHGRCDQYAVHPKTGKLFVPWSFISLFTIARVILMIGSVGALAFFTFGNSEPEFVPLSEG